MDLLVPQLSSTMESARVVQWLKQPGDAVRLGEPVLEVETDKTAMEIESPAAGVLQEILVGAGEEVSVGGVLGRLTVSGGAVAPDPASPAATTPPPAATPSAAAHAASVAPVRAPAPGPTSAPGAPATPITRIKASPLAKRLASESGIPLQDIRGTGPNGRIRKRDVLRLAPESSKTAAPPIPAAVKPLPPMRVRIAETVTASRQTIPSFSLDRWVESTHLSNTRSKLTDRPGVRVTVTDMLLQAVADSLGRLPSMLDRWVEGATRPSVVSVATVDVGLVVAVEGGLLIPTLSDLGGKSLSQIARMRQDAVARARAGRLSSADSAPASLTISNLGTGGADRFEAIINPGQSSILAIGREHERAVASGGRIYAARGMHLTLSVDHRLIDGRLGAEFLGLLAQRIETGAWRTD